MNKPFLFEAKQKIERFCAYQERCHFEVYQKLKEYNLKEIEIDNIIVYLLENNFLNEERFAKSFVRGKHNYKKWGKVRISNELRHKKISSKLIEIALKEIHDETYFQTFHDLAEKIWKTTSESNTLKKRKKCCDYLLRKGYESDIIYEKIRSLEAEN